MSKPPIPFRSGEGGAKRRVGCGGFGPAIHLRLGENDRKQRRYVRFTSWTMRELTSAMKRSRIVAKRLGGSMPYATVESSAPGSLRKSGPGQMNSFHSDNTIQERASSSCKRCLTLGGISTARLGRPGGVCVIGNTSTRVLP